MRIATWNLERGGRSRAARTAQEEALKTLLADVVVLTEPSARFDNTASVLSPAQRHGARGAESWVAIIGDHVAPIDFAVPYERLAVTARANIGGGSLIVYGAVLPWLAVTNHAPYLVREGETSFDVFKRVLAEQAADVVALRKRYDEPLIWAGDFNEGLTGPTNGGSTARRAALAKTLAGLGLEAWNGAAAHAQPGLCAVDLICGDRRYTPSAQGRLDPVLNGIVMSDHAGYWVDIDPT